MVLVLLLLFLLITRWNIIEIKFVTSQIDTLQISLKRLRNVNTNLPMRLINDLNRNKIEQIFI